jgi:hypothetical protein
MAASFPIAWSQHNNHTHSSIYYTRSLMI